MPRRVIGRATGDPGGGRYPADARRCHAFAAQPGRTDSADAAAGDRRRGAADSSPGRRRPEVDMLCGSFHYNRQSLLLAALPEYLVVSSRAWQANGQLTALIALLRSEADGQQLGARTFIDSLSSALFTLILRAWLTREIPLAGTLALLADKRLSKAWQVMLADPGHAWTIDSLADAASMSRATFMRAFVNVAGVSPWVLLTQLRMELAFNLLRQSRLSLIDIAARWVTSPRRRSAKNSRRSTASRRDDCAHASRLIASHMFDRFPSG
nr:AraC family transcriptional regulator [Pseudomonas lactucae]